MKPTLSKHLLFALSLLLLTAVEGFGQQGCDNLHVDLDKGRINGVKPTAQMNQVKKKLPCSTGETSESEGYNCGGGVFYLNHDFYCYTGQDYIEVRRDFKGKVSKPVLNKTDSEIEALLGKPDMIVTGYHPGDNWFYRKPYGTLRITFDEYGVSRKFGMHAVAPEKVELCL